MKNKWFLVLFLSFLPCRLVLGDGNVAVNNFSDYVNSLSGPVAASGGRGERNIDANAAEQAGKKERSDAKKNDVSPAALLQGIPSQWQACGTDRDCTAAVADCISWDALNKKFLKKLKRNVRSCSQSIDPGFQPLAVCSARRCRLTEKTTGLSWEEWLNFMRHSG